MTATAMVGVISGVLAILGTLVAILRWIIRLNRRFEQLERHDKRDYEARGVLIEGVHASLDGLRQLGANGNVTAAEENLRTYLYKK